jgi:CRP/FNR family cyclic AMP-dependent transcriptional regulator
VNVPSAGSAAPWPSSWPESLVALARSGVERRYRRGLLLMQEGEPGGSLYFVLAGRLRAYRAGDDGQEFTYGHSGAGEVLGELSLDGGPRSANVVVEEDALCRVVDGALLRQRMAADPELAYELLCRVIRRARVLSERVSGLKLHDSYGRLAQLLAQETRVEADGTRITQQRWTQAELAQRLDCARTMVTRLVGDLRDGGYLRREVDGRWRVLRDLPPRW